MWPIFSVALNIHSGLNSWALFSKAMFSAKIRLIRASWSAELQRVFYGLVMRFNRPTNQNRQNAKRIADTIMVKSPFQLNVPIRGTYRQLNEHQAKIRCLPFRLSKTT